MNKLFPYFLVAVQLSCLLFIAVSGPLISNNTAGIFVESSGVFLALLSLDVVKIRNVNVAPIVKENSELITSGPYRIVRHPMYIAQIIAVLPLVIDYFSWYRLIVLVILMVTLLIKIEYEEKQLMLHFDGYNQYKKNTKKLIPFIY